MKTLGTHNYFTYILTNKNKTVLYIGVTNNLHDRIKYHEENKKNSFPFKYKCFYLIYFEYFSEITQAIAREKQLKGWKRDRKEELIANFNPNWKFLNNEI
ncbi:MAG: endonuclease [Lutibacter sp.]|nr:MAG: endonuclease [Lutibacter sp.]